MVLSVAEVVVGVFLRQWPDEPSTVILESFLLSHLLRSGVLRHCLEEGVKESVVVLSCVDRLESYVLDA